MEIKKNENVYENAELKVIHLTETDIITTSTETEFVPYSEQQ